jgi:hypothetical protein
LIFTDSQRINFLEKIFGSGKLFTNSKGSRNLYVICPNCFKLGKNSATSGQKKLAIEVNTQKSHCWVCNKKYISILPWLVSQRKLLLKEEYEQLYENNKYASSTDNEVQVCLPDDFRLIAAHMDEGDFFIKRASDYLLFERALSHKDLWKFKFGISADKKYQNRIIIPSFGCDGMVNYFLARATFNSKIKYLNCDYDKNDVVFNELYVDWTRELILVEGPLDLVNIETNATCLLGSTLTTESRMFHLLAYHKTPVILCLDADAAEKQRKIAELLYSYDIPTKIVKLDRKDPGFYSQSEFKELKPIEWSWKENFMEKVEKVFNK